MCACYIWCENSPAYNVHNSNLFDLLQNDINHYNSLGATYVCGDFNARIGTRDDFIRYDCVNNSLDDEWYSPDIVADRLVIDKHVNSHGLQLLDICKATGMRVCNGRLDKNATYTYYGANGCSTIDYLLSNQYDWNRIKSMGTIRFNEFSDHAIVEFSIYTNTVLCENENVGRTSKVKWNDEYTAEYRSNLITLLPRFNDLLQSNENMDVNQTVNDFVSLMNEATRPLFVRESKVNKKTYFIRKNPCKNKDWFDQDCVSARLVYRNALDLFNGVQSSENRTYLINTKRAYKRIIKYKKKQHKSIKMKEIEGLKTKRPREFWKYFRKQKSGGNSDITCGEFYQYFKNLVNEINITSDPQSEEFCTQNEYPQDHVDNSLDCSITVQEVRSAIRSLKRGKAGAMDDIINEYFIEGCDIIVCHLTDLFNIVFSRGYFPDAWTEGVIVPIYKKGDRNDVNNYRGITLVSAISKLFTSIINKRLTEWCDTNNIIPDAQFGFRKGLSTTDAVYCLTSVIQHMINSNKRLYVAFIDMKKCFDSVYRNGLWFKMHSLGISSKILKIVRSMYRSVKNKVRHGNSYSEFLEIGVGLKQGEICSPLLWSLFIEDLEQFLNSGDNSGLHINSLMLIVLLYADDMALMAESPEQLQSSLDDLKLYCDRWGLTVNSDKTKVMVFRKCGRINRNEKWFYNNEALELVSNFNYLGVVFGSFGNFNYNNQMLIGKALKAMNVLLYNTKDFDLSLKTQCQLFDAFVSSILNYSAEVWGYTKSKDIERIQLKYCKRILNVKLSTSNCAIYGELGRLPMYINRFVKLIKYWFKVLSSDNSIICNLYDVSLNDIVLGKKNWASNVKDILYMNGFGDIWENQRTILNGDKWFVSYFKQRLIDCFSQTWSNDLSNNNTLTIYKHIKHELEYAIYLEMFDNKYQRQLVTKMRISAHRLRIETGRHGRNRMERHERVCEMCDTNQPEDEFHFILQCSRYRVVRRRYINDQYWLRPSMMKLCALLDTKDPGEMKNLALYIGCANKIRDNYRGNNEL